MKSESKPSSSQFVLFHGRFCQSPEQHDYQFQKGQVVRGKVFQYESDGAYVDIGGKAAAFRYLVKPLNR